MKIENLFAVFIYLAIGLVFYLVLCDYEQFSWLDPWLFVYLALWPAIPVFFFLVLGTGIVVFLLIVEGICNMLLGYQRRKLRKLKKRNKELTEQKEQNK